MKIMFIMLMALLIGTFAIQGKSEASPIKSTFDFDTEGWTAEGRSDSHGATLTSGGGVVDNPGGYLRIADIYGDWLFAVAPNKFHTDWRDYLSVGADVLGDTHPITYGTTFFLLSGSDKWKYEFATD